MTWPIEKGEHILRVCSIISDYWCTPTGFWWRGHRGEGRALRISVDAISSSRQRAWRMPRIVMTSLFVKYQHLNYWLWNGWMTKPSTWSLWVWEWAILAVCYPICCSDVPSDPTYQNTICPGQEQSGSQGMVCKMGGGGLWEGAINICHLIGCQCWPMCVAIETGNNTIVEPSWTTSGPGRMGPLLILWWCNGDVIFQLWWYYRRPTFWVWINQFVSQSHHCVCSSEWLSAVPQSHADIVKSWRYWYGEGAAQGLPHVLGWAGQPCQVKRCACLHCLQCLLLVLCGLDEATRSARSNSISLPLRVSNLCELLVFVKNLELSCTAEPTPQIGTK